jgi:uncharacterized protein (TIGR03435 family)
MIAGIGLVLGGATAIAQSVGVGPTATQEVSTAPAPWSSPNGGEPEFEVATIKPSDPAKCCSQGWGRNGRHFNTHNMSLRYLIQWAWRLQSKQLMGGPQWMDVARFDIVGEIDGDGVPNDHQWRIAVRKLLIDRFQLQLHEEKQEMPTFALVVARGGPKLTAGDGNIKANQTMGLTGAPGQTMYGFGLNASIDDFIGELQRVVVDRPIVDQTGLTGVYNIRFSFTREEADGLGMTQLPDTAPPNLLNALPQQLGLNLKGTKASVNVVVIDHAEPPEAN